MEFRQLRCFVAVAEEAGVVEKEALKKGMEEKSRAYVEKGGDLRER